MKDNPIDQLFPNQYSLGKDQSSEFTDSEKSVNSGTQNYPSLYVYSAPAELADKIHQLAKESEDGRVVALVYLRPTRVSISITSAGKNGLTKDPETKSSLDLEVLAMALPEDPSEALEPSSFDGESTILEALKKVIEPDEDTEDDGGADEA